MDHRFNIGSCTRWQRDRLFQYYPFRISAVLQTVRLKKSLIPCESIFKRKDLHFIGGSGQLQYRDFRQDTYPAGVAEESKATVDIEFLPILMFV